MKRHFALPLAITLSLELVVFFLLPGHPASAQTPKPPPVVWPKPFIEQPDEVTVSNEDTGSPRKSKTDVPSPVVVQQDTPPSPSIDFAPRPIDMPSQPFVLRSTPARFYTPGDRVGVGPLDATLLDNAPRAVVRQPPVYPYQARSESLTGDVIVDFVVDLNGRVLNAHAVSSTNSLFEEAAIRAVSQWRFEPGQKNGHLVRFRMRVPIQFRLDGN